VATRRPTIDEYWAQLARVLPDFPRDQQDTAVALYRALAHGRPLDTQAIAEALGTPPEVAAERIARDPLRAFAYVEEGHLVGFGGLAVAPMHHEFRVAGRTLWTWCAWDSLFIPAVLDQAADVSSPDPQTHETVRLRVSPTGIEHVTPSSAVVSFLLPDEGDFAQSTANVMGNFCHHVFFFASATSAEHWRAAHPGTFFYTPQDAFALGAHVDLDAAPVHSSHGCVAERTAHRLSVPFEDTVGACAIDLT